ncbi:MAG TPA: HAD-IA family hydrolase [Solirubrobacteraceae bacterium]
MQRPRLAIFDCDGVLVDSEVISNDVLAQALTAEGLPTTLREARRDYQGLLLSEVLSAAESKLGRALPHDWLARYERDRSEVFRRELRAVSGAAQAVAACIAGGIEVCVASQGKLEKTRLSLELTGLRALFDERSLFSAHLVARGKPHPDLFLHAAETMGVAPGECVVVEDSPSGVLAGRAAQMRVLGYAADSDATALERAGAEIIFSLSEVPPRLGLGNGSGEAVIQI